jgi:UDP-GlcNAc:undecaprenyl-phosphate GlcNAc-1-phosphate transferase
MLNSFLTPVLFFFISLLLSYYYTFLLLKALKYRNIYATINPRSSHEKKVPTLGGMVFFAVAIMSIGLSFQFETKNMAWILIPSLTVIATIGFKDDLIGMKAWKKFLGQIFALGIMFFLLQFNFEEMQLEFDFKNVFIASIWCKLGLFIFMLFFINAVNFIDGIDGLAGLYSLVVFGILSLVFLAQEQPSLMLICFTFMGILTAFLYFNTSQEKKIFMGDTGSLILGLTLISLIVMAYLLKTPLKQPFTPHSKVLLLVLLVSYPIYDALRMVVIRLSKGKKFYAPDQNHIHHVLIRYFGWSHWKTSLFINTINLVKILCIMALNRYVGPWFSLSILLYFYAFLSWIIYRINKLSTS